MERDDILPETDETFMAAIDHFLDSRRLTIQELCHQTRAASADGKTRLIHPNQFARWRRHHMPNHRHVMVICETLGIPRSFFFLVGELLRKVHLEMDALEGDRSKQALRTVEQALPDLLDTSDVETLEVVEEAVRRQRDRLREKAFKSE